MGYSLGDVNNARTYIRDLLAETIFENKGGINVLSFDRDDVSVIFALYDKIFFHNQITEKVKEMNSGLAFYVSDRNSGAGGVCSIERDGDKCTYYIDIAPKILDAVVDKKSQKRVCDSRLGCLLLIIEHQIVHLLMILWGYDQKYQPNDKIFGSHGSLFRCMCVSYFQHTNFQHDLGFLIDTDSGVTTQFDKPLRFGYAYWSNSCYLDSLTVVLLGNISPFWRDSIFTFDTSNAKYVQSVCFDLDSPKSIQDHAKKIQEQLQQGLKELSSNRGVPVKCLLLRNLLAKCLPDMKEAQKWVTYNVATIYRALVDFFPILEIDYPRRLCKNTLEGCIFDPLSYKKRALFQMWDYMDPLEDVEQDQRHEKILWDRIDSPVIVFYNGGTPRIKNFVDAQPEYIYLSDDEALQIRKARSFGPRIINNRYELVGVITLQGVTDQGDGTHYIAYFMGIDSHWYYYNDMAVSGKITSIDNLSIKGVWKEDSGLMPSMYFYRKVVD